MAPEVIASNLVSVSFAIEEPKHIALEHSANCIGVFSARRQSLLLYPADAIERNT
jgi:hypothetical protein